jgi:hypothetical protein
MSINNKRRARDKHIWGENNMKIKHWGTQK